MAHVPMGSHTNANTARGRESSRDHVSTQLLGIGRGGAAGSNQAADAASVKTGAKPPPSVRKLVVCP